jgi:AcrR family transcriptional regulator
MARLAAGPTSEERRQQIIDAALRVFACKGFMGATNKDIALEAGITPGLLYHYFADKRALFEAVLMEHTPLGDVSALLADDRLQELAPRELLLTLIRVMVTRLEASENVGAFQCLLGEAMHEPETTALFNAKVARVVDKLAGYLRGQMEPGRLRPLDPTLVAQLITGSVMACVMRRKITRDPALSAYSVEQIATTLAEMVLGGLEVPAARESDTMM